MKKVVLWKKYLFWLICMLVFLTEPNLHISWRRIFSILDFPEEEYFPFYIFHFGFSWRRIFSILDFLEEEYFPFQNFPKTVNSEKRKSLFFEDSKSFKKLQNVRQRGSAVWERRFIATTIGTFFITLYLWTVFEIKNCASTPLNSLFRPLGISKNPRSHEPMLKYFSSCLIAESHPEPSGAVSSPVSVAESLTVVLQPPLQYRRGGGGGRRARPQGATGLPCPLGGGAAAPPRGGGGGGRRPRPQGATGVFQEEKDQQSSSTQYLRLKIL